VKTDDLIHLLSTNVEPVKGGELRNTLVAALALGAAAALCLTFVILGAPEEVFSSKYLGFKLLGLSFALGLVAAGMVYLLRAARPGKPGRGPLVVIGLLFLAILCAGIVAFATSAPVAWIGLVFGPQWAACLLCIPLFAIVPFASLVWTLRKDAPTHPVRTGAVVGLVAGALGAAAFAVHQPADSILFLALWYGGPILVCVLVGALLGPRLLRW
jgi:hypothetical protein